MIHSYQYIYPSLASIFGGGGAPVEGALQELVGFDTNLVLQDEVNPLVVDPEPEVRDVSAIAFVGGTSAVLPLGNVHSTQNPHVFVKFNTAGGIAQYMYSRRSEAATEREYHMFLYGTGELGFGVFDVGGDVYNTKTTLALSVGVSYEAEGWYDRVNENTNLRYRAIGATTWIYAPQVSTPNTLVLSGALGAQIGWAGFTGSAAMNGSLWDVVIKDYATGALIGYYPLEEGEGIPYDVSGNDNRPTLINAAWTTVVNVRNSYNFRYGFQIDTPFIPALLVLDIGD